MQAICQYAKCMCALDCQEWFGRLMAFDYKLLYCSQIHCAIVDELSYNLKPLIWVLAYSFAIKGFIITCMYTLIYFTFLTNGKGMPPQLSIHNMEPKDCRLNIDWVEWKDKRKSSINLRKIRLFGVLHNGDYASSYSRNVSVPLALQNTHVPC